MKCLAYEKMGANVDKVRIGIGSDPRIGKKFLYAGPGYGGSCFPKDVSALVKAATDNDINLEILTSVKSANEKQKDFAARKFLVILEILGVKLAVWGLAFKPGTDDVRESPAFNVINLLVESGAKVRAHDPEASENFKAVLGENDSVDYVSTAYEAAEGVDAICLVTDWPVYRRPSWKKVRSCK